jgi:hypothetical protein
MPLKVRLLRSFHSVHEVSSSKVSKARRASGCSSTLCCIHHSPKSSGRSGTNTVRPTGSSSKNHSCLATTHPSARCSIVSFSWPHGTHSSVSWRSCRFLRSVVHSLRGKATQKKNFTFGGTFLFQSSRAPSSDVDPPKKAR